MLLRREIKAQESGRSVFTDLLHAGPEQMLHALRQRSSRAHFLFREARHRRRRQPPQSKVYIHGSSEKIYLVSINGRDCRPKRRRTFSALVSARLQTSKAVSAFFLPFGVKAIFRTRWSSWATAEIQPRSSINRKFRDNVVRSRPSSEDNSEMESGPVCARVARTVNWVARSPLPRKCRS
jgi:hypothetical protein